MAFSRELQEIDGLSPSQFTETDAQLSYQSCKRSRAYKDFEETMYVDLRDKLNAVLGEEVPSLEEAIERLFTFASTFDPCVFFEKFNDFVDKNENEDCNGLVQWIRKFLETSSPYCKVNEV